jgi:hypothetical protein
MDSPATAIVLKILAKPPIATMGFHHTAIDTDRIFLK